jgi:hypothetical protein
MPMVTARPAFAGSALWFLGNPTSAGMHEGTLSFTATTPGTYHYLCPVPGHSEEGMAGTLTVRRGRARTSVTLLATGPGNCRPVRSYRVYRNLEYPMGV